MARTAKKIASDKAWYQRNKEKKNAQSQAYYAANKQKIDAINKSFAQNNPEKVAAYNKKWAQKNRDQKAVISKQWAKNNPEKISLNHAKRRLLQIDSEAIMTAAEKKNYQELILIRDEATKTTGYAWSIDHIIPLTKGGTNAIDNLEVVPLSWNQSKNNRSTESYWGTA